MERIKKERYTLLAFALFPCMVWGVMTLGCIMIYDLNYPEFVSNHIYHITYLLRALVYLSLCSNLYKRWSPGFYDAHKKIYLRYSLLAIIAIVCGFFVKTRFWNYILDGCFVSPFIEEVIARFILYKARKHNWKLYAVVTVISSLAFSLMHIAYNASLHFNANIRTELGAHFVFGCILCSIFWFFPRLSLLISIHSISNLWGILATKLGYPW
ncbi:CPBP family intramembrane glutamic endopeptidase [Candidatus Cardinium hertigii]|uniref:CAAX prenyl protease 2/Lysostaphin resistance protein A-like domain-containing protein n=1 Tax=Candidatus Cardinium hertigii TaxID=247481 RepID=A0A2Z3L8B9_9BACT|nr:CPBP family intramembrane glutamic endopeptidase [Candidatus Cardinium hertigii]AWN81681.1 hypothetical protein DK880_00353 [Candidatus Cardinium hertigii]